MPGFALLLVITLLAFLVLILLGLAVFTRVETSIAGNTQRQAQARENALLALNVALGQLQLHAGSDTRVTATARHFNGIDGTLHYTGVWSSNTTVTDTPAVPLTWLVSGNELRVADTTEGAAEGSTVPAPLAITPAAPGARTVELVGRNSTGSATRNADYVIAPLTDITAAGVPGVAASTTTTIGRYAYWVGDQGVKAPVAVSDSTDAIAFAPYDSAELRSRIRQQLARGAGAATADGEPAFETRDTGNGNANLVANDKVTVANQLAFLRNDSNAQLGLAPVRQNLHAWSPNNFAVLANTKAGGLRQDLSLAPTLLGNAFAAWANYSAYMEKTTPETTQTTDGEGTTTTTPTSTAPTILPAYSADPIRRRYVMTPHLSDANASHQVGPVLTYFLISFNVRTVNNSTAANSSLEVRARWMATFWNPYTSSLVPEDLLLEVTGLPSTVRIVNDHQARAGTIEGTFSLDSSSTFGSPLRIALPWASAAIPAGVPSEDRSSWLPGRAYTWRSKENVTGDSPSADGYESDFYSRTLDDGGKGVVRPLSGTTIADGGDDFHLDVSGTPNLRLTLYAVRPGGRVRIGGFISPEFETNFQTDVQAANRDGYQFSYVFRLAESIDTIARPNTWLTTDGRDIRRRTVPQEAFVVAENGDNPRQYGGSYKKISSPDRLLDRAADSYSYNEDVPVFELPRGPILSMGALQHLRIPVRRPFMIGNPWGVSESLNNIPLGQLFDRFFFSGLVDGVTPATTTSGDLILPNPLLKPLRKPDGKKPTIEDVHATVTIPATNETPASPSPAEARSSKFFLQGGAFNLNSVNAIAWAAVLRGVRFPTPTEAFTYLDASAETGTADDTAVGSVAASGDAQFFRFSQSAQETYKAEPGMADNDPNTPSPANTHLFRRGMRTLSAVQVKDLAAKIVELVGVKHAAAGPLGGPFRSLEEFLSPSTLFAASSTDADGNPITGVPRSLLEAAIADAGINAAIPEFSSQWLTQADVMTALAPILFARSDTFVIRTYGEAVNPIKLPVNYRPGDAIPADAIEGRAWAEAIVQRVPEYFDPSDPPETMPAAFDTPSNVEDPSSAPTLAHQLNKLYGRRFKVVSFRWLTRSDI